MKATFNRATLLNALRLARRFASKEGELAYLKLDVAEDATTVSATNGNSGVVVGVDASKTASGAALLGKELVSFIRTLRDETITIKSDGEKLRVSSETSSFSATNPNPAAFPSVVIPESAAWYVTNAALLKEFLSKALVVARKSSPGLQSVLLDITHDRLHVVAATAHRLIECNDVIARSDGMEETARFCLELNDADRLLKTLPNRGTVRFRGTDDNRLVVTFHTTQCLFPLVYSPCHCWREVVPDPNPSAEARVDICLLRDHLGAFEGNDDQSGVRFTFQGYRLLLSNETELRCVPIVYNGPDAEIRLNAKYVLDFLRANLSRECCRLQINGHKDPVVFLTETENGASVRYVLMPIA